MVSVSTIPLNSIPTAKSHDLFLVLIKLVAFDFDYIIYF